MTVNVYISLAQEQAKAEANAAANSCVANGYTENDAHGADQLDNLWCLLQLVDNPTYGGSGAPTDAQAQAMINGINSFLTYYQNGPLPDNANLDALVHQIHTDLTTPYYGGQSLQTLCAGNVAAARQAIQSNWTGTPKGTPSIESIFKITYKWGGGIYDDIDHKSKLYSNLQTDMKNLYNAGTPTEMAAALQALYNDLQSLPQPTPAYFLPVLAFLKANDDSGNNLWTYLANGDTTDLIKELQQGTRFNDLVSLAQLIREEEFNTQ
jgi:hypothetical protein